MPFVTGQYTNTGTSGGSVSPFQTIQREEVGTILKVTPQINEGDAIVLKIDIESSSVIAQPRRRRRHHHQQARNHHQCADRGRRHHRDRRPDQQRIRSHRDRACRCWAAFRSWASCSRTHSATPDQEQPDDLPPAADPARRAPRVGHRDQLQVQLHPRGAAPGRRRRHVSAAAAAGREVPGAAADAARRRRRARRQRAPISEKRARPRRHAIGAERAADAARAQRRRGARPIPAALTGPAPQAQTNECLARQVPRRSPQTSGSRSPSPSATACWSAQITDGVAQCTVPHRGLTAWPSPKCGAILRLPLTHRAGGRARPSMLLLRQAYETGATNAMDAVEWLRGAPRT